MKLTSDQRYWLVGLLVRWTPCRDFPQVHASPIGVIPKKTPGKWRLIVDLSAPRGSSVNDGVDPQLCSLKYATVDMAARQMALLGQGAQLAKIDIARAYRNVPIHPDDRHLLGMLWQESLFIDTTLPFGLRSAPKIFSALADGVEWVLSQKGVRYRLHYLDDFLVLGAPRSKQCQGALETMISVCSELGLPLADDKIGGPATQLVFLGIELDSEAMELRLPNEKIEEIKLLIAQWKRKRAAKKRQLLSFIGHLVHAATVVTQGRTFIRRMLDRARLAKQLDHFVRLNQEFRSDLRWWDLFMDTWNGKACVDTHLSAAPQFEFTTDASGAWGCGASWASKWFQIEWNPSWRKEGIAVKELLPIVMAIGLWGAYWAHARVKVWSDNMSVVAVLRSRTSKDTAIMHQLRSLHFLLARQDIALQAAHIPGKDNLAADHHSRNNMDAFILQVPHAEREPTPIHPGLHDILVSKCPDWTSTDWCTKLTSSLKQVLPSPPSGFMPQANGRTYSSAPGWACHHSQQRKNC